MLFSSEIKFVDQGEIKYSPFIIYGFIPFFRSIAVKFILSPLRPACRLGMGWGITREIFIKVQFWDTL